MEIGKEIEVVEIETPAVPYEGEEVQPDRELIPVKEGENDRR